MSDWGIQTEGMDETVEKLVRMALDFKEDVGRNLNNLGQYVSFMCKVELADVRYRGELEKSFVVEVDTSRLQVQIYPQAKHRMFVRMGTRPHWAPIGPLKLWAAAKLGDERLAYPVQWSIHEHGTSMRQMEKRGEKANPWPARVVIRPDFTQALQRTAESIGADIVEHFK